MNPQAPSQFRMTKDYNMDDTRDKTGIDWAGVRGIQKKIEKAFCSLTPKFSSVVQWQ